jgi:hypothetical protein
MKRWVRVGEGTGDAVFGETSDLWGREVRRTRLNKKIRVGEVGMDRCAEEDEHLDRRGVGMSFKKRLQVMYSVAKEGL